MGDGELAEGVHLWRKGIVYTKRPDVPVGPGYRVSAAFKGTARKTNDGFIASTKGLLWWPISEFPNLLPRNRASLLVWFVKDGDCSGMLE